MVKGKEVRNEGKVRTYGGCQEERNNNVRNGEMSCPSMVDSIQFNWGFSWHHTAGPGTVQLSWEAFTGQLSQSFPSWWGKEKPRLDSGHRKISLAGVWEGDKEARVRL